ncbi:MAG: peroxiredoxin-like family protein [Verrucomicrobiales bacterium]|nr:peroxiredoxin-like family protein [Verrucomicrobiales bacterium]
MTDPEPESTDSSLRERIDAWSRDHASDFPEEVQNLFARKTEEVLRSGILDRCLQEGDRAPDFSLPSVTGEEIRLSEILEKGPVILSFYRGTWCPYCNLEFVSLLEAMPQFQSRKATVLAISPQMRNRREDPAILGFHDLCDHDNRVAKEFGLVHAVGEEIEEVYRNFGIQLDHLNDSTQGEIPIPATYLIDQDYVIRYAHANADIVERAEPSELIGSLVQLAA